MPDESGRSNTPIVVVVVAVVGLLASVGSAALGGYWANKSVERQLESQRSSAVQDQRREVYVAYLRAATEMCQAISEQDNDKGKKALIELENQQAAVLLIAGPALNKAVDPFFHELTQSDVCFGELEDYNRLRQKVLEAAQPDLK
jgi:hypothetical protein